MSDCNNVYGTLAGQQRTFGRLKSFATHVLLHGIQLCLHYLTGQRAV